MPRSSSNSKSPTRSSISKSIYKPIKTQAPAQVPQTIQVQQETPSMLSSVKQGFGWGVGTSIARNIFSGNTETIVKETKIEVPVNVNACFNENDFFIKCLKEQGSGMCFQQEELLKKCLENK